MPGYPIFYSILIHREFAGASLKELSIPLVEDKTGQISRSFAVFDPTTHTAVPTAFILDEEGELMASFSTSTKVFESNSNISYCGQRWGALQRRWRGWWLAAGSATRLAPGPTSPRALQYVHLQNVSPVLPQLCSGLLEAWPLV